MNASSSGTSAIYEKYNTAFYLVNGASAMSYAANPITKIPAKQDMFLAGIILTDYSTQIIQPGGYITNSIANTYFLQLVQHFLLNGIRKYILFILTMKAQELQEVNIYMKNTAQVFYLDASASGYSMTGSSNCITVPAKNGYTFAGYYTAVNGGGTQVQTVMDILTLIFHIKLYGKFNALCQMGYY